MRYAIVSDIHANWQAWSAVRDDFLKREVNAVICLGDTIGYGPNPAQVLADLRKYCSNLVLGNHDSAVAGWLDLDIFNDAARKAAEWTMTQVNEEGKKLLREWPLEIESDQIMFVHAETVAPDAYGYVEQADDARVCFEAANQPVTFLGHTHRAGMFVLAPDGQIAQDDRRDLIIAPGSRYIINVGSVGDPRDGTEKASYGIFDDATGRVELLQVSFDCAALLHELKRHSELGTPWFLRNRGMGRVRLTFDQAIKVEKTAQMRPSSGKRSNVKIVRYALSGAWIVTRVPAQTKKVTEPEPVHSEEKAVLIVVVILVFAALLPVGYLFWKKNKKPKIFPAPPPPLILQVADQRKGFKLGPEEAILKGVSIKIEFFTGIPNIGYWSTRGDSASWTTTVNGAGEYDVELDYALDLKSGGAVVVLACGDDSKKFTLRATDGWYTFRKVIIGRMRLPDGQVTIALKPDPGVSRSTYLINLRSITFQPITSSSR